MTKYFLFILLGLIFSLHSANAQLPVSGDSTNYTNVSTTGGNCGSCLQRETSACTQVEDSQVDICLDNAMNLCVNSCKDASSCEGCVYGRIQFCKMSTSQADLQNCINQTFETYCDQQTVCLPPGGIKTDGTRGNGTGQNNGNTGANTNNGSDNFSGGNIDFSIQGVFNLLVGLVCWFLRAAGLLIVLAIVWSGILIIYSQGDKTKYEKGRETLKYALIGALVIFGVFVMINTVAHAVGANIDMFSFSCSGSSTS